MMSLNIYLKNTAISKISYTLSLKRTRVEEFLNELDFFGNNRLYVSSVQRFFSISKSNSLKIIAILVDLGILKNRYQVKLDGNLQSEVYKKLTDVPIIVFDEETYEDKSIDLGRDVFIFFMVNHDD